MKEPKRSGSRTPNPTQVGLSALAKHQLPKEQEPNLGGLDEGRNRFRVGTWIEPRNLGSTFQQILSIAKLSHVRIHDLRHTTATLLLTQGIHPRVVMDPLGHSQIAITMNTYSHFVPALRMEVAY